jgi:tRNA(adenine34) deaminase
VSAVRDFFVEPIIDLQSDAHFMKEALRLAAKAQEAEEVPVGAVVVSAGKIIARAFNQVEMLKDATAHAEMLAITQAEAAIGDWRLNECDLYVTKEPCAMCAGALVHVRMRRVIFGCADPRSGAAGGVLNLLQHPALNHRCEITRGVLEDECAAFLQGFFRAQRNRKIRAEDRQ